MLKSNIPNNNSNLYCSNDSGEHIQHLLIIGSDNGSVITIVIEASKHKQSQSVLSTIVPNSLSSTNAL